MTKNEHTAEAERLAAEAQSRGPASDGGPNHAAILALVHAQLAAVTS